MKTLAYLDCPTGIAGDMCLGALVHAGVPLAYLDRQLGRLGISDEFHLRAELVQRQQQAATKVFVDLLDVDLPNNGSHQHRLGDHEAGTHAHDAPHHHGGRHLPEIERLIQQAGLPERVVAWSLAVFRQLAQAEAAVHGIAPEQVHFHEVGASDAIVDIVGTCLGLDWLKVDGLVCSPLPTGSGTVWCEHGQLPVPAPAVLRMMAAAQMPVYDNGIAKELVTPTGCAIAATLSQSFGPPPRFTLQKIGLGAGGRDLSQLPNILRLWIGSVADLSEDLATTDLDAIKEGSKAEHASKTAPAGRPSPHADHPEPITEP
ncbi:MAG: nickel pincer cofactor biosynthesis protein LarC, partial [Phormidesmis sp.]